MGKLMMARSSSSQQVVRVKREKLAACMTCPICNKLLNYATTISDCLHSFCRKCIYDKITDDEMDFCPVCNLDLGCTSLEKLRADHNLDSLRAKVFPLSRSKEVLDDVASPIRLPARRKERSLSSLVVSTPRLSSQTGLTEKRTKSAGRKVLGSKDSAFPIEEPCKKVEDHPVSWGSPEILNKLTQSRRQNPTPASESYKQSMAQKGTEDTAGACEGKDDLWTRLNFLVGTASRTKSSKSNSEGSGPLHARDNGEPVQKPKVQKQPWGEQGNETWMNDLFSNANPNDFASSIFGPVSDFPIEDMPSLVPPSMLELKDMSIEELRKSLRQCQYQYLALCQMEEDAEMISLKDLEITAAKDDARRAREQKEEQVQVLNSEKHALKREIEMLKNELTFKEGQVMDAQSKHNEVCQTIPVGSSDSDSQSEPMGMDPATAAVMEERRKSHLRKLKKPKGQSSAPRASSKPDEATPQTGAATQVAVHSSVAPPSHVVDQDAGGEMTGSKKRRRSEEQSPDPRAPLLPRELRDRMFGPPADFPSHLVPVVCDNTYLKEKRTEPPVERANELIQSFIQLMARGQSFIIDSLAAFDRAENNQRRVTELEKEYAELQAELEKKENLFAEKEQELQREKVSWFSREEELTGRLQASDQECEGLRGQLNNAEPVIIERYKASADFAGAVSDKALELWSQGFETALRISRLLPGVDLSAYDPLHFMNAPDEYLPAGLGRGSGG